ncbi:hypothetical protein Tco_1183598 [Tanacetum coccineum]
MQQPMQYPEDISNPTTTLDMALVFMSKAFTLNDITPTNNNQRSSSNPSNMQIAQPGMNMEQDRQIIMVEDNVRNQFRPNAVQNVGNQVVLNIVQNPCVQNVGNQNGLSVDLGIANQYWIGNVITARAGGNGINGNQIRCYNCQGVDQYAMNCTVKPRKRDAACLQIQLHIAQKEEAGIQLNFEEFDFMATAGSYNEIKEATANCTLKNNLQQASTLGTQTDSAHVYDLDGSAENDSNVISAVSSVEQSWVNVEKVNTVNHKVKETNADLTTELARKSRQVSAKMITTLNEEIANSNNQLSKEKSIVSSLQEEKKKLKFDFKIREDELLDKQIQFENKIKELDNILNPFYLKQAQHKQQSLYNGKVLLEKHDPPVVYDSEETLQLAQESRLKMKQLNKEIKPENYAKINQLLGVFVSQKAKSHEELYFSNTSKTAIVSKSILIPNEEFSDDTSPSVAQKFQNETQPNLFAKEVDESLAKHKTLEFEIERLLRAVVSKDIMSIMQSNSVVDTSNLQTELDRTKEKLENCIIKKEKEHVVLWNNWYTKCEECKYDKISYDKAYNDMQQKIKRLQAQLGDLKGKSKDTPCVSDTLDPLSQKLENENVELENSEQKDTTRGTSMNTQFRKQSILGKPPSSSSRSKLYSVTPFPKSKGLSKIDETHALSKPITSNSVPSLQESKVMKNNNLIAPRMFRITPFKTSRVDNFVPNKHVKASIRTKPITVSQPHVITKKDVNSITNGFSPKNVESTTRTRRPQLRNNPKND